jgi:hypothetical protein
MLCRGCLASNFGRGFAPFLRCLFAAFSDAKVFELLAALSAAASQRGFNPRPAQVSLGLSGLRYFGATLPRAAPRHFHRFVFCSPD